MWKEVKENMMSPKKLTIKITFEQMQQGLHPRQVQTCQLLEVGVHQHPGFRGPWQQFVEVRCVC
jgi:hypothetical protein